MSKAVVTIIKGGLGNQLFIYSASRALALRTGRTLYLDNKRGYTNDGYGRSYRLHRFPVQAEIMPEGWRIAPTLSHPRHKIIRAFNKCLPRPMRSYYAQRWHLSAEQLTALKPVRDRILLNGYWPDEAYFADYAGHIHQELRPPLPVDARNLELGAKFAAEETIFIHARRVRYPTLLPVDYYERALAIIRENVSHSNFAVFSDDFDWVKKNIPLEGANVTWVEHNRDDELADLWLMTQCRHSVMANSSFSWWGAWLGRRDDEGRCIITPDNPRWIIRPAAGWKVLPFDM